MAQAVADEIKFFEYKGPPPFRSFNINFDFGDERPIWRETIMDKRDALVNEVTNLEDFSKCFDLTQFPLPMDVSYEEHAFMCHCGRMGFRKTIHVGMKIKPRNPEELKYSPREADGTVRLKTCVGIDAHNFAELGNQACFEKVRAAIRNMALHEVYESVQFRGMRVFDPHNEDLRPKDQPF